MLEIVLILILLTLLLGAARVLDALLIVLFGVGLLLALVFYALFFGKSTLLIFGLPLLGYIAWKTYIGWVDRDSAARHATAAVDAEAQRKKEKVRLLREKYGLPQR